MKLNCFSLSAGRSVPLAYEHGLEDSQCAKNLERESLQSRLPVDHDIDRQLGSGNDHEESSAIGRYVVVELMAWLKVNNGCLKESLRDTFFKMGAVGARTDRHGHQLSVQSDIEQLFSITAPARSPAPELEIRNLPPVVGNGWT